MTKSPITPGSGAVLLRIYAQPRASRTEVVGLHGDAIKIRLAAPPVDGAANEELVRFLAKTLDLPQSSVRLVAGASGRRKQVSVAGIDLASATRCLRAHGAPDGG